MSSLNLSSLVAQIPRGHVMIYEHSPCHYLQLQEAATWILNAIQWFNVLEQPMMTVIWSGDWEDAAKFQYLMQILQVNFED